MTKQLRLMLGVCLAGVGFGVVASVADFYFGRSWHGLDDSFFAPFPVLIAGLVGGAGGLWALVSLLVAYVLAQKFTKLWLVVALNIGFLTLAVASYYIVAPVLDTHQDWYPAMTILFWLEIAVLVGTAHGAMGNWLRGRNWQKVAVILLAGLYLGLDCVRLIQGAATNQLVPQAVLVSLFYATVVGLFAWQTSRKA